MLRETKQPRLICIADYQDILESVANLIAKKVATISFFGGENAKEGMKSHLLKTSINKKSRPC